MFYFQVSTVLFKCAELYHRIPDSQGNIQLSPHSKEESVTRFFIETIGNRYTLNIAYKHQGARVSKYHGLNVSQPRTIFLDLQFV